MRLHKHVKLDLRYFLFSLVQKMKDKSTQQEA